MPAGERRLTPQEPRNEPLPRPADLLQASRSTPSADGHGIVTNEPREWEDGYRKRWQHDKIVRSTHGVNCTGSCSWKIYVKGGIVTWETQQTDYPRTRPDLPNHEPRGCARGASYSWYLYSANRVKYPMVRGRLLKLWREARETLTPVAAWASIVEDPEKRASYTSKRGLGGFVRASWDEVNEIIAAANAYTVKKHGPDRVIGFSPIPAMSMVSYAAGARYLSLIGGVCMCFYDWYCDLPPASPKTWGEQTDVPESADWYNAGFLMIWGSNVPQTRTPDAHFYTEVRYKGTKSVVVSPDYAEATKFADLWLHPKQGTDAALALAMGHVILREYLPRPRRCPISRTTRVATPTCRCWCAWCARATRSCPSACCAPRTSPTISARRTIAAWKTVAFDQDDQPVVPLGSVGFRWGQQGKWNLEDKEGTRTRRRAQADAGRRRTRPPGRLPLFRRRGDQRFHGDRPCRRPDAQCPGSHHWRSRTATRWSPPCSTCCAPTTASTAASAATTSPRTMTRTCPSRRHGPKASPACRATHIIPVAREFATNAEKTNGRSMVIIGAGMNHWYHMDMTYRGIINMLVFCGCVGQSGGGWSHYVGQEKLRPQTGWTPLAFALDWAEPPRHMNATSFFYAHTDQWRYETLNVSEILSPTAPDGDWTAASSTTTFAPSAWAGCPRRRSSSRTR